FLTARPLPSSPLFPYTTLFRSSAGAPAWDLQRRHPPPPRRPRRRGRPLRGAEPGTRALRRLTVSGDDGVAEEVRVVALGVVEGVDRKSTRLNSSHVKISYAVFC